jgi:antitoxin ParD1/3/4
MIERFLNTHYNYITMVMETLQIRLTKELVDKTQELVKSGLYPNKSEVIRDAVRKLILERQTGSLKAKISRKPSTDIVREIRKKLSKSDARELNNI